MSIEYVFTQHGTLRIGCEGEWIEMPLHGGGDGSGVARPPTTAGPAAAPVVPKAPPPPLRGRSPEPSTPPGVMFIDFGAFQLFDTKDLFVVDAREVERWNVAEFQNLGRDALRRKIRDSMARVQVGALSVVVLDVDIGKPSQATANTMLDLRKLLRESNPGFDALRVWHNERLE